MATGTMVASCVAPFLERENTSTVFLNGDLQVTSALEMFLALANTGNVPVASSRP